MFISVEFIKGDPFLLNKYDAQIRYVADRTGIGHGYDAIGFPFAGRTIFAMDNGWNYNTFMTYHRHIARVMFMLIVIHAVCYYQIEGDLCGYERNLFDLGCYATVCGGIILFQRYFILEEIGMKPFVDSHCYGSVVCGWNLDPCC